MFDTIAKAIVLVIFVDYLAVFGLLLHWVYRTSSPSRGRRKVGSAQGIAGPH